MATQNEVQTQLNLGWQKFFGLFFSAVTIFFFCYFIWSFFHGSTTVFQLIGRGANILIFAYITQNIHSQIRARVRYGRDQGLYAAVAQMQQDAENRGMTTIGQLNVYKADDV